MLRGRRQVLSLCNHAKHRKPVPELCEADCGFHGLAIAPVIPGLSDPHIPELLKRAKEAGARTAFIIASCGLVSGEMTSAPAPALLLVPLPAPAALLPPDAGAPPPVFAPGPPELQAANASRSTGRGSR